MAKRKSDTAKLKEKRCSQGDPQNYVAFFKANEAGSIGTSSKIFDPIANRFVDTLSVGERRFFLITRWNDDVKLIEEQRCLSKSAVDKICAERGFKKPLHIITTDFLVTYKSGIKKAFSLKSSRKVFSENNKAKLKKLLERQVIEKTYWNSFGIEWELVFTEDLNRFLAANIATVMQYYNDLYVDPEQPETFLKYLIAHKMIEVDMTSDYLNFTTLLKEHQSTLSKYKGGQ